MKKFLLLMSVIIVAFQFIGYGQTGFDVLWKIDNWGSMHNLDVSSLARFSSDGKSIYFVADSSYDKLSRVYQVSSETGEPISQSEGGKKIVDFDLSEAGNVYVTANSEQGLKIWNAKTYKLLDSYTEKSFDFLNVFRVAISPDEKYVIFCQSKRMTDYPNYTYAFYISIYAIESKKIIKEFPSMYVTELRYSRDGKTFVAGGVAKVMNDNGNYENKERLLLYDATTWKEKAVLAETYYENGFNNIHYSFDSKYIGATGTYFAGISNVETMQTRKFNNDATYGYYLCIS